jgi:hypothetical protein
MCGRNFAQFTSRSVSPRMVPFGGMLGKARDNCAKTFAAALIGALLSGPVMAEEQTRTAEGLSQPASRTQTSNAGAAADILSLFVDSPERRQLAKEVERLLRESTIEEAESHLNKAIDVGTLAVLLLEHLRTPSLLAELQALGLRDDSPSAGLPSAAGEPPAPTSDELAELKAARDREQQRADALARDFATATEELHALRSLRAQETASAAVNAQQWAELRASFEKEHERADAVTRDLAAITEERHAQQKLREHDATLIASTRREVQELKEELGRERQRNQAASAANRKAEHPLNGKNGEPIDVANLAPDPNPSSPGRMNVQTTASVQASTNAVRGVPNVLDTATLSLQGRIIQLFGVETDGDAASADEFTKYLDRREVECEPAGPTAAYQCQVGGMDLSMVVLFNGGGRAAPNATPALRLAADEARAARVVVWNR